MDRREALLEQVQLLVARWNAAAAREQEVRAEMSRLALAGGDPTSGGLMLKAQGARTEMETLRRKVARLKVEPYSGKQY